MPNCFHLLDEALIEEFYASLEATIFFYKYTKNGEQGHQLRSCSLLAAIEASSNHTPSLSIQQRIESYIFRHCFDRNETIRNIAINQLSTMVDKYSLIGEFPQSIVSNLYVFPPPLTMSILHGIVFLLGDITSPLHAAIIAALPFNWSLYPIFFEIFPTCKLNGTFFDSFCTFLLFLFSIGDFRSFVSNPASSQ